MSAFLDGIGSILGKLSTFVPGRIEGLKNEKKRLEDEKKEIESKEWTPDLGKRVDNIYKRLSVIDAIIESNAKD